MDPIKYQREAKETFHVFTDEDVTKLLEAPNKRIYTGFHDYVMMLVLVDTGLRIKELTHLRIPDIDFKLRQITVRGEIAKTHYDPHDSDLSENGKGTRKVLQFMNVEPDDFVWLTQFGERYYADTFGKMLKKYAKKDGVSGPRVSPHTFRHYAAVKFLRSGGDPIALARILGHTSLNMTQGRCT